MNGFVGKKVKKSDSKTNKQTKNQPNKKKKTQPTKQNRCTQVMQPLAVCFQKHEGFLLTIGPNN